MKLLKWFFKVVKDNRRTLDAPRYLFKKSSSENRAITLNLRRDSANDEYHWDVRKEGIVKMVADKKPDIFCVQECMPHMWKYLENALLVNYRGYGVDAFNKKPLRDSKIVLSEGVGIFFNREKYDCFDEGYIRLSKGIGFDTKYWRICAYVGLADKTTNERTYVFTTHLDHKEGKARKEASKLIHDKVQEKCEKASAIICGDFNCEITWPDNISLLVDNYQCSVDKCLNKEVGTVSGFGKKTYYNLDFFLYKGLNVGMSEIITQPYGVNYLSDHYPVMMNIEK